MSKHNNTEKRPTEASAGSRSTPPNGDFMMWMHGHTLWSDMPDRDNDEYDDNLRAIYQIIYQHGTPKTRQDLEQMGLVDRLGLDREELRPF
jgi:hypothetical protein